MSPRTVKLPVEVTVDLVVSDKTRAALVALGWTPPGALPPLDDAAEREHPGHGVPGEGVEYPADGVMREFAG